MELSFKHTIKDSVVDEILSKYGGKYILRDGDLHAEIIDHNLIARYFYTPRFLNKLASSGLVFNTFDEAEEARRKMLKSIGL